MKVKLIYGKGRDGEQRTKTLELDGTVFDTPKDDFMATMEVVFNNLLKDGALVKSIVIKLKHSF